MQRALLFALALAVAAPAEGRDLRALRASCRHYGETTNKWLNSADASLWGSAGTPTITANTTTAPDGTLTADSIAFTGTTAGWDIVYQGTWVGDHLWSCWMKWADGGTHEIFLSWGAPSGHTVLTVTGVWTRVSGVVSPSDQNVHLGNHNAEATQPAGWAARTLHVWGCNLVSGAALSPYIATGAAPVTRAAGCYR